MNKNLMINIKAQKIFSYKQITKPSKKKENGPYEAARYEQCVQSKVALNKNVNTVQGLS